MSQQQFSISGQFPPNASPPVFEQIFKNARFAQGGNALFEGKIRGNPKPTVTWTRKGSPLFESQKFKMTYEEQTGNVSLLINKIGPGDEGEYTCTARNQYGEAICSVYIQPEGMTTITCEFQKIPEKCHMRGVGVEVEPQIDSPSVFDPQ